MPVTKNRDVDLYHVIFLISLSTTEAQNATQNQQELQPANSTKKANNYSIESSNRN